MLSSECILSSSSSSLCWIHEGSKYMRGGSCALSDKYNLSNFRILFFLLMQTVGTLSEFRNRYVKYRWLVQKHRSRMESQIYTRLAYGEHVHNHNMEYIATRLTRDGLLLSGFASPILFRYSTDRRLRLYNSCSRT